MRPRVRALKLAKEVRIRLSKELGQPVRVIMFGSQARGDADKDSDIAWEVGFDAGRVISAIPDTKEQMKRFAFLPFYQNIKREGIAV
ncbi:MAG: hypothetical protein A3K41_00100 [Chloroflexi bacterium RIFOXYD12_FULL_57_15]|nr:MAG: hypothetical protein A3K41_00100 [Chloroflexi bacterium RIFOXYD12_FULL_57_15]